MRSWSISAGHLFGVEFRIHLTFLFLLFFVWVTEPGPHNSTASLRGVALVGMIFVCVVIHELAHAILGAKTHLPTKAIVLLPIGGVTLLDETRQLPDASQKTWIQDV